MEKLDLGQNFDLLTKLKNDTLEANVFESNEKPIICLTCKDLKWVLNDHIETIPCPNCLQIEIDNQRLKNAKIKKIYMKHDFDSYPKDGDERLLKCTRNWTTKGDNNSLLLMGSIGSGKTSLGCCALRYRIVVNRMNGLFLNSLDLIENTRAGFGDFTANAYVNYVKNVDILMLDDVGNADTKMEGWKDETFQSIIAHRHDEELQTIYTTNLDYEQLCKYIGVRAASRIKESTGGIWWYETAGKMLRK